MPRAIRGSSAHHLPFNHAYPLTHPGVLVECDPSIKAIIVKLDSERNDFIVEELDDQTLVINEAKLGTLKMALEEVSCLLPVCSVMDGQFADDIYRNLRRRSSRRMSRGRIRWG